MLVCENCGQFDANTVVNDPTMEDAVGFMLDAIDILNTLSDKCEWEVQLGRNGRRYALKIIEIEEPIEEQDDGI